MIKARNVGADPRVSLALPDTDAPVVAEGVVTVVPPPLPPDVLFRVDVTRWLMAGRRLTGQPVDRCPGRRHDPGHDRKAGLRHVRTFHLDWADPIPGSEQGEVEYELLRSDRPPSGPGTR